MERFLWVSKLGIAFQISHLRYKSDPNKNSLHIIYYNIIAVVVIFDLIIFISVSSQAPVVVTRALDYRHRLTLVGRHPC